MYLIRPADNAILESSEVIRTQRKHISLIPGDLLLVVDCISGKGLIGSGMMSFSELPLISLMNYDTHSLVFALAKVAKRPIQTSRVPAVNESYYFEGNMSRSRVEMYTPTMRLLHNLLQATHLLTT